MKPVMHKKRLGYAARATQSLEALELELQSAPSGLTDAEASRRLLVHGPNVVIEETSRPLAILARQFISPLSAMLFGAAALAWIVHERIDAIVIAIFFLFNGTFSFFQEFHADRTMKRLLRRVAPSSLVLRGGKVTEVPRREIVVGDVILLDAGDEIPADCRLIEGEDVAADESVLSGESEPVSKSAAPARGAIRYFSDASNILFAATILTTGSARALVYATGMETESGEIVRLASEAQLPSSFENTIRTLSWLLMKIVGVTLAVVFAAQVAFGSPTVSLTTKVLFVVALAIAMIPEALPVVISVAFARGAQRLAKKSVVVKRLSAVEDLGHVNVLCIDKTGTITEGTMNVTDVVGHENELARYLHGALERGVGRTLSNIAYEGALREYFGKHPGKSGERRAERMKLVKVLPFDPIRRRSSKILEQGGKHWLLVQGAPEEILRLSHKEFGKTTLDRRALRAEYEKFGMSGKRTLAFAVRELDSAEADVADERDLTFLALVAFVDPIKKTAKEALRQAEVLKVDVRILTGDSLEVAEAVARSVGILGPSERAITGDQLMRASPEARAKLIREIQVFARVTPEEKYLIVRTLEQQGRRVAFMGDGVNDAPALKAAHVGLAVATAADISKGVADIVLLKRDLHVIVEAVGYGREIFANVVKYVTTTLVGNFGNFYTVALLSFFIPYLPLLPVQILLLNMLTDLPLVAVSSDTVDRRDLATPHVLNTRKLLITTFSLGLVSSIFDLLYFVLFRQMGELRVQTLWFVVSVFTELLLIFSLRTWKPFWRAVRPSTGLAILTAGAAVTTTLIPFTAFGQEYFHFIRPHLLELGIVVALAAVYLIVTDVAKLALRKKLSIQT